MSMIIFLLSVDDNIFAPVNPDVWDIYLGGDCDGPPIFELEVYQDIQENYIEDKTLIGDIGGASMLTIQFSSIAISESFTIEYTIHIEMNWQIYQTFENYLICLKMTNLIHSLARTQLTN